MYSLLQKNIKHFLTNDVSLLRRFSSYELQGQGLKLVTDYKTQFPLSRRSQGGAMERVANIAVFNTTLNYKGHIFPSGNNVN